PRCRFRSRFPWADSFLFRPLAFPCEGRVWTRARHPSGVSTVPTFGPSPQSPKAKRNAPHSIRPDAGIQGVGTIPWVSGQGSSTVSEWAIQRGGAIFASVAARAVHVREVRSRRSTRRRPVRCAGIDRLSSRALRPRRRADRRSQDGVQGAKGERSSMSRRRILVTSALPYVNSDLHLGYLVE